MVTRKVRSLGDAWRELSPASARRPVVGLAGWSGAGKTTLLAAIIPHLRRAGVRIALIKHAHHRFDVDHPGKDSHTLRKAGASQVLLTSGRRYALMVERDEDREPVLEEELGRINQDDCDLILVEGFRDARFPKIEVYRPAMGRPAMYPDDTAIVAVATDGDVEVGIRLPLLDLNAPGSIADYILENLNDSAAGQQHRV